MPCPWRLFWNSWCPSWSGLEWSSFVAEEKNAKKSMVRQSHSLDPTPTEKRRRWLSTSTTTTTKCCRPFHKKEKKDKRGWDGGWELHSVRGRRRGGRQAKKRGSSHGPSSLLVHYICFADALTRAVAGASSAAWGFLYIERRREPQLLHMSAIQQWVALLRQPRKQHTRGLYDARLV